VNPSSFLQLVSDRESHEATHETEGNGWAVEVNSANDNDGVVGHFYGEVVDGAEVLFVSGLCLIERVGTETYERSGHTGGSGYTGVVVNNEYMRMDAVLLDRKEFDQEVPGVFCGHNLPLVLTHSINGHAAQLADSRPVTCVSKNNGRCHGDIAYLR
jgi:hypothetical protein